MENLNEVFKRLSETMNGVNVFSDETKEKIKLLSRNTIFPESINLKETIEFLEKEGGLLPKIGAGVKLDIKLDEIDRIKKCFDDALKPLKDLENKLK